MDILNQYKVKFSTPLNYAKRNRIDTINDWLSLFIEDHNSVYEANRLLSGVNDIINSNDLIGVDFDTPSMYVAHISSSITKIYQDLDDYLLNNDITPSYSIPTLDFRFVVEEWKNYLMRSKA